MTIKGKKKSGHRGSQGRRRPAGAPRVAGHSSYKVPWYRTAWGRVGVAVGVVVLIASIAGGVVLAVREDPTAVAAREGIENYTDGLRATLEQISVPVGAMAAAPVSPDDETFGDLEGSATEWETILQETQFAFTTQVPPEDLQPAHQIFAEAVSQYAAAARTYGLAAGLDGGAAEEALLLAAELRDRGTALWEAARGLLDSERADLDLAPSGLTSPATAPMAPGEVEQEDGDGTEIEQEIEIPEEEGEGNGSGEDK